ncbi:hypothetical protein [Haloplanus halophilus]|uniref:hypothetical protein n=1 Tax=Haloplanus halophilus TaxID=2949993 RepID=UPI002040BE52|nr:hypothetical protein [Haloplanus sp. GDY1]
MRPRRHLEATLREESRAYGYSLSIWGAGALLIGDLGVPSTAEVFAFAAGAVAGFAALALAAFGSPLDRTDDDRPSTVVVSMIHVLATLGSLGCAEALLRGGTRLGAPGPAVAFLVAAAVTVAYSLLLLVEEGIAELVA